MVDFGTAVRRFYGNYFNPHGRSPRAEYWWVVLFQIIVFAVCLTVLFLDEGSREFLANFGQLVVEEETTPESVSEFGQSTARLGTGGLLSLVGLVLFGLINIIPDIMLKIRRFHDLGQTGWLVLGFFILSLIPLIGTCTGIGNAVWFALQGTEGENKYGPDPYAAGGGNFGGR